ncbi:tRNA (guanosine(46)-N7)-methyltransferase TrmB [Actinomycetaceae bacterium TAE3-ERU4]|nr:tRNA (guanosine(46)-N7)-methyltransferase TrmB [Actinomycetaceae bacterium TAE3-ERU4]
MEQEDLLPDGRFRARTKSFVRRGNRMAISLENTWNEYAPTYMLEVARRQGATSVAPDDDFNLAASFPKNAPLVLEIGCGTGDQIVAAAQANPQYNYLGLEVWRPGIAKTISKAVAKKVTNLRLIEADAVQVLSELLEPNSLNEVWTFFPDPWRKARHHKRRLVQIEFAQQVLRVLQPGGVWRLATDWDDYAWHIREVIENVEGFENPYRGRNLDPHDIEPERGGFAPRFKGRVLTRFENRGIRAGRSIHDFEFVKSPSGL